MSLEIASVMSPVGVNTSIVHDGFNGFLAGSSDEWKEKLSLLLENKELRFRLGKAGKQTIEDRFSVNALKSAYLNLFRD
jgi:glycosyltransferase involved in cell wall biosynthesis